MGAMKNCIPWNKGLTKKTDKRLLEQSKKVSISLKGKSKGIGATIEIETERRKKISQTMKKNPNSGGLRIGSGRGKKSWYESKIAGKIYVRSTYELEYVKWLDANNINWRGNKEKFSYQWEGQTRFYYPDFYLIDEQCYVEIKGFETQKDKMKWKFFPGNLKVLKYKELKELGLNVIK